MDFLRPFAPQLLSILRIISGLIVVEHATAKYLNFPTSPMNNMNPMTMSGAAGIIEAIFGSLLVIGLFTRFSAFILSGLCAIAYFYAHAPRSFFPLLNGGELAVVLTFVYLYVAAAGAGPWSVDRAIRGSNA
jgi:putative oxidoreductase